MKNEDDPVEFDDMDSGDWEQHMSGPDDGEIPVVDSIGGMSEEEGNSHIHYIETSNDERSVDHLKQSAIDYYEYRSSSEYIHSDLCDELVHIINDNHGAININEAFSKLSDQPHSRSTEIVCILLAEKKLIETQEAVKNNKFVLSIEGIEYAKSLLPF